MEFNELEAEQKAIDSLINRGIEIPLPKRSILRLLGLNKIYEPYTGTLDRLADIYIKMEFDEEQLRVNPISESNHIIRKSSRLAAKAVAVAWLNGKWKCKLFTWLFTDFFLWNIKPSQLLQIVLIIRSLMNAADFINSTRLMTGTKRTTMKKPDLVEEKLKA